MKLLVDHNLSHKILPHISKKFPDSAHLKTVGLEKAGDLEVWEFAKKNGYTILSQDSDFYDIGFINGFPPKIIWIRRVILQPPISSSCLKIIISPSGISLKLQIISAWRFFRLIQI